MEWDLQFVAIIVTVLLAVGGAFWRIIATMNKGFAEARREAREGRKEARAAVDKLRTEMNAGFAAEKEAREKGFAAAEKAREKGFADAKEERREIKAEMNRRFDAVEARIASGRTGESLGASGREADRSDDSGESSAGLVGDSALGQDD